jgi:cell division septal protein FtsQ
VRYLKAILLFFSLVLGLGFFMALPRYMRISRISCSSQFGPCSLHVKEAMAKIEKANLSLFEAKKELKTVLSSDVLVTDFSFQFKLPKTLQVNLLERKPKFALKKRGSQAFALVDSQGVVVSYQNNSALPVLIVSDAPPNVGEVVSGKTLFALEILSDIFSLYQVKSGNLEDESLVIELKGGLRVIFPLEADRKVLLGSLRLILGRLNEESNVSTIDLRYKNPILK